MVCRPAASDLDPRSVLVYALYVRSGPEARAAPPQTAHPPRNVADATPTTPRQAATEASNRHRFEKAQRAFVRSRTSQGLQVSPRNHFPAAANRQPLAANFAKCWAPLAALQRELSATLRAPRLWPDGGARNGAGGG